MKFFKLIGASVALFACGALGFGQGKALSVKQWQEGYSKAASAFGRQDTKAVSKFLTSDWKRYSSDGKLVESGNDPAKMAKGFAGLKSVTTTFKVVSVKNKGKAVVVKCAYTFSMWTKPGADKKSHKILSKGTQNDTWVSRGGKWLMSESRSTKDVTTMDGKPIKGNM